MLKHGKWTHAVLAAALAASLVLGGLALAEKGDKGGGKPPEDDPPPPPLPSITYSLTYLGTLGGNWSMTDGMNNSPNSAWKTSTSSFWAPDGF